MSEPFWEYHYYCASLRYFSCKRVQIFCPSYSGLSAKPAKQENFDRRYFDPHCKEQNLFFVKINFVLLQKQNYGYFLKS